MKLIFNIDKDDIMALLVLMKPSTEEKKKFREWIGSHDEIEIPDDLFDKEGSSELMMAMGAVTLAAIAKELDKE